MKIDGLKFFQTGLFLAVFFALPACDLYEESWTTSSRLQVKEEKYFETFALQDFDTAMIAAIANQYDKAGDGPLSVNVTYDPNSRLFTAMKATNESARISQAFQKRGVKDVQVSLLPVQGQGEQILVSYMSYSAHAPEDCTTMPGFSGNGDVGRDKDYKIGCTIETLMARQARPKDLKGNDDASETVDGRRLSNAIVDYRDGIPNEPLDGESATGSN